MAKFIIPLLILLLNRLTEFLNYDSIKNRIEVEF